MSKERVLVLGFSQPTYHTSNPEQATIQLLLESSHQLRRLFTIPQWYFDQIPTEPSAMKAHYLPKFQWIDADIKPHPADSRQDSVVLQGDMFEFGDVMPHEDSEQRRGWLDPSPNMCDSVAAFRKRWEETGDTLGIVIADKVHDVWLNPMSNENKILWETQAQASNSVYDISCSDVDFMVRWSSAGETFETPLRQWGLHILYSTMSHIPDRDEKALFRMREELNTDIRDVYMFLGAHGGETFGFDVLDTYRPLRDPENSEHAAYITV